MVTHRSRLAQVVGLSVLAFSHAAFADVIVDNDVGAPAYSEFGPWSTGSVPGYDGGMYRFTTAGETATATWAGILPDAGAYEVSVWYVPSANRAKSTKYDIAAADQVQTVYIDQTAGGYTWESLGIFPFNAGANTITLDAGGSSDAGVVVADAVRFALIPEPATLPLSLLGVILLARRR